MTTPEQYEKELEALRELRVSATGTLVDPDHDLALRGAEALVKRMWERFVRHTTDSVTSDVFGDDLAQFQRARAYWLKVKGSAP